MTLSVLVDFGNGLQIRNPSAEIESNPDAEFDISQVFRDPGLKFYCPHCYLQGAKSEVKFRNPQHRRVHFFHQGKSSSDVCPGSKPESDQHINAKAAIAEHLKVLGLFEDVRQEWWMKSAERRPDILAVYPNGAYEAHEVQVSEISPEDLKHRTEDLRTRGQCAKVVWYLGKAAFTRENRQFLRSLSNVECYRLAFESADADFPTWQIDDRAIPQNVQASRSKDACKAKQIGAFAAIKTVQPSKMQDDSETAIEKLEKWLKKHGHKKSLDCLAIGARVTGVEGRTSHGWTGVIVGNEPFKDGRDYWQVRWWNREFGKFDNKSINNNPIIGNTSDQLVLVGG